MLEHVPASLGRALAGVRPGLEKLVGRRHFGDVPETVAVESPAFTADGPIPAEYTADGAGLSPPLNWRGLPPGATAVVLIVEDADSPTPEPLVHAMVLDLPGKDGGLEPGALAGPAQHAGEPHHLGRNSFLKSRYLPPDPPKGHGPHRYAFQVFALDEPRAFVDGAGRGAVVDLMRGHVLARGLLVGTYERVG